MATKKLYTNANSRVIHNSQKVEIAQCTSTDKWVNKMWYIHTMDYYLATKKNAVLIHAKT